LSYRAIGLGFDTILFECFAELPQSCLALGLACKNIKRWCRGDVAIAQDAANGLGIDSQIIQAGY